MLRFPMNYFGHAVVAAKTKGATARFVLGAMLPDLARLADLGAARVSEPELRRGVAFHLRTDALFHDHPLFVGWQRDALARFHRHGISKGPLRAAAHVGVEMLLDDALARDEASLLLYEEALAVGTLESAELLGSDGPAFPGLCALLKARARSQHPTEDRLALRLEHTLSRRPRLRATEQELSALVRELTTLRGPVGENAERLVKDLLDDLSDRGDGAGVGRTGL